MSFLHTHQSLGLLDVFVAKEKLAIEITEVNSVQIDDVNLPKAREDKVLQQFTANAPCADQKHARLQRRCQLQLQLKTSHAHLLDLTMEDAQ